MLNYIRFVFEKTYISFYFFATFRFADYILRMKKPDRKVGHIKILPQVESQLWVGNTLMII